MVVEFSFKYKGKGEEFDGETAKRAYDVFVRLKDELAYWVDPEGLTKTAYVYTSVIEGMNINGSRPNKRMHSDRNKSRSFVALLLHPVIQCVKR